MCLLNTSMSRLLLDTKRLKAQDFTLTEEKLRIERLATTVDQQYVLKPITSTTKTRITDYYKNSN